MIVEREVSNDDVGKMADNDATEKQNVYVSIPFWCNPYHKQRPVNCILLKARHRIYSAAYAIK